MTDKPRQLPSPSAWRRLGLAAVALLTGAVTAIGLISAGVFDPQSAGPLRSRQTLAPREIEAEGTYISWMAETLPAADYTLRLTAEYISGETDIGYGLVVGKPERYVVAAVSPSGYVAVWKREEKGTMHMMPWQTWPHVHLGREQNEIEIDKGSGELTVRVNRELLWNGRWEADESKSGIYGQSFGKGTVVNFQELVRFGP